MRHRYPEETVVSGTTTFESAMEHVLAVTSPISSPRQRGATCLNNPVGASDVWGLTKDFSWPASRGSVTALLPDLVAINLELSSCTVTAGHIALTFRYSDTVSNYSLVVVLDAIPEQKFDQAFQVDLIKALCRPPSSELRSKHETCRSANTDMLISRHESPVTHVAFLRSYQGGHPHEKKSMQPQKAHPLRCVITREDGGAYAWEWSHDRLQWTYLNCFNVATEGSTSRIGSIDSYAACGGSHGVVFRSTPDAASDIMSRLVSFDTAPTLATHPTRIVVGPLVSVLPPAKANAVIEWMRGSHVGLWMVTSANDIFLRSATSPGCLHTVLNRSTCAQDSMARPTDPTDVLLLRCVHTTTGALVTMDPVTGQVWTCQERHGELVVLRLPYSLPLPQDDEDGAIREIASHRQFVLALTSRFCFVFDVHTGARVAKVATPDAAASFWTGTGVGLWSWNGVWRLKVPSAKQYAQSVATSAGSRASIGACAAAAMRHLDDFGPSLQFDQAAMALQVLRYPHGTTRETQDKAKRVFDAAAESPAWMLSLLADHTVPASLEEDLHALLYRLHQLLHTDVPAAASPKGDPRATPLNYETYNHLRAWLDVRHRRATIIHDMSYLDATEHREARATNPLPTRDLLEKSSLHLASLMTSLTYGSQLLTQLEHVLDMHTPDPSTRPSHVLFHDERVTALESVRHPAYFEWVARLTFQHRPAAALDHFIHSIASACPRVFTLNGVDRLVRPHADRALAALPPMRLHLLLQPTNVDAMVLAYTNALWACHAYVDALQWLLRFQLYARAKALFPTLPRAVQAAWFWQLLQFVARHDTLLTDELVAVVGLKPKHIPNGHVLSTLHRVMPRNGVPVHMLRPLLATLVTTSPVGRMARTAHESVGSANDGSVRVDGDERRGLEPSAVP